MAEHVLVKAAGYFARRAPHRHRGSGRNKCFRALHPGTVDRRFRRAPDVQHLQLSWAFQFIRVKDGKFRLGPMVEADGFLLHGKLAAPNLTTPITETEDLWAGLPTVGLAMDINPVRTIDIFGEASGMRAGSYGYFVSSDAGVRVRALRHLLLTAGYRTFSLHVESSPDFAHMRLHGPFIGAGFSF